MNKLYREIFPTDLIIEISDRTDKDVIKCHKVILFMGSGYFRNLFHFNGEHMS